MAGYHVREISRGEIGKLSKIQEEFWEFWDAVEQRCIIMALVELSDLLGAVKQYFVINEPGINFEEWLTQSANFEEMDIHVNELLDLYKNTNGFTTPNTVNALQDFIGLVAKLVASLNLSIEDVYAMTKITERVFKNGYRTPRTA